MFLLPALFTLMFTFIQGSLIYSGKTAAIAAAEHGARAAAAEGGTSGAGITAARSYLVESTASTSLTGVVIDGERGGHTTTITVSAHTLSLIPGWKPTVNQSATMPVEEVTG